MRVRVPLRAPHSFSLIFEEKIFLRTIKSVPRRFYTQKPTQEELIMNAKTLLFGIAAAALISAGTAYAQGPRPPKDDHNNGVRLAADIVNLVKAATSPNPPPPPRPAPAPRPVPPPRPEPPRPAPRPVPPPRPEPPRPAPRDDFRRPQPPPPPPAPRHRDW